MGKKTVNDEKSIVLTEEEYIYFQKLRMKEIEKKVINYLKVLIESDYYSDNKTLDLFKSNWDYLSDMRKEYLIIDEMINLYESK